MPRLPGSGNHLQNIWEYEEDHAKEYLICKDCYCYPCKCDDEVDEEILKRKGV